MTAVRAIIYFRLMLRVRVHRLPGTQGPFMHIFMYCTYFFLQSRGVCTMHNTHYVRMRAVQTSMKTLRDQDLRLATPHFKHHLPNHPQPSPYVDIDGGFFFAKKKKKLRPDCGLVKDRWVVAQIWELDCRVDTQGTSTTLHGNESNRPSCARPIALMASNRRHPGCCFRSIRGISGTTRKVALISVEIDVAIQYGQSTLRTSCSGGQVSYISMSQGHDL
ncbi:hypothetical protein BX666DRAFT_1203738 [Dichotomocladium elegans]|nr:hypothetical protein BX666DRAFT_1203738 [Dichotomocladium elegans]